MDLNHVFFWVNMIFLTKILPTITNCTITTIVIVTITLFLNVYQEIDFRLVITYIILNWYIIPHSFELLPDTAEDFEGFK